jgi:hypothetical protein
LITLARELIDYARHNGYQPDELIDMIRSLS